MGFFVADRSRGEVMGQFPHAFPSWIAIAYGLDPEAIRSEAVTLTVVNSNSPMRLDGPMADLGLTRARAPVSRPSQRLTFPSRVPVFRN